MVIYVPGTEEIDPKKQNMSLQQLGAATTTNQTNIATNTASIEAITASWSTWSPTFTMATVGGTPITAATSGQGARYIRIGKTVHFALDATISNIGVGNSGFFQFTLPIAAFNVSACITGTGFETALIGKMLAMQSMDATRAGVRFYDGSSLITAGNGARVQTNGTYETA